MDPKPEVSIVLVNYNQPEYTAQCLDSIYQHPPESSYEIILVDNASADGSPDWLEAHYPQVRLIRSPANLGIAGGNNLGIFASRGRYILLLNNDTLVLPGNIDRAVHFLDAHPQAAGVGGNLLNQDGSFQSAHNDFHTLVSAFLDLTKIGPLLRPNYPSHPRGDQILQVDWLSTAFMLFPKAALDQIQGMDEEYFIYSDETDLQYRLVGQGGVIYYLPELETIHFGGKSLDPWRRRRLMYRGRLLFFHRHRGPFQTLLIRSMYIAACLLKLPFWAIAWLFPGSRERAKAELASHQAILRMSLKPGIEPP